ETLPKRKFCPRTYPYNHNLVLTCICFLKETLSKRRFCPKTYSYVHNSVLICIYFLKETLPKWRFCRNYIHIFTNIVLICIYFLKKTLPKQKFCPETYPYIHKKLCSYGLSPKSQYNHMSIKFILIYSRDNLAYAGALPKFTIHSNYQMNSQVYTRSL
ncbi:hypothetical protein Taro_019077, partial [Colocasia esculenta]|nr:hypothetical protein [Colocasia esculenta]